jgi:predicted signal transduction protein with EAL and GGDEF domain
VARVVAFVPDLLFGSNVVGALKAAGHDVVLTSELGGTELADADVLVVDLTADAADRIAAARAARNALGAGAELEVDGVRTLAFYSHVETDVRALADEAGFDLVVPRSRMAREGPALVAKLAGHE